MQDPQEKATDAQPVQETRVVEETVERGTTEVQEQPSTSAQEVVDATHEAQSENSRTETVERTETVTERPAE